MKTKNIMTATLCIITIVGFTANVNAFLGINCSKPKPQVTVTNMAPQTPAQAAVTATNTAATSVSSGTSTTVLIPNSNQPGAVADMVTFYPVNTNGGPIGMVRGKPVYIPNGSSKNVTIKFALADGRGSITLRVDSGENAEIYLLPGHYTVAWTVPDNSIEGASTLTVGDKATDYVVGEGKAYAGIFTLANQR